MCIIYLFYIVNPYMKWELILYKIFINIVVVLYFLRKKRPRLKKKKEKEKENKIIRDRDGK